MLFDEDLQQMFRVAYFLHTNREIAYEVTRDGIRKGEMKLAGQNRRPPSTRPNKQRLSLKNALLSGVFAASENWETDQESRQPLRTPRYVPTDEDFLARYAKKLVWHSMERDSEWVSIAIGHFLYCYPLNEIARLSPEYFDDHNMWRTRAFLDETIRARFQWEASSLVVPGRTLPTIQRPATDQEFQHLQAALRVFAPFADKHPASCLKSGSLLETYLFPDSSVTEGERIHALISPECAGWVQFVDEFNKAQSMSPEEQMSAPRDQLRIPICPYGVSQAGTAANNSRDDYPTPESRANPEPLSKIELTSLRRSAPSIGSIIELDNSVA